MSRQSTGKRLRFEILKRDGFRCRYCGAAATSKPLHVDHVVPVAEGGETIAENLVAACADCNGGKSYVKLDESVLVESASPDAMLEHAEQIRAYLAAVKEREAARAEVTSYVFEYWCEQMRATEAPTSFFRSLANVAEDIGIQATLRAVDTTAAACARQYMNETNCIRYFHGVVRNKRNRVPGSDA